MPLRGGKKFQPHPQSRLLARLSCSFLFLWESQSPGGWGLGVGGWGLGGYYVSLQFILALKQRIRCLGERSIRKMLSLNICRFGVLFSFLSPHWIQYILFRIYHLLSTRGRKDTEFTKIAIVFSILTILMPWWLNHSRKQLLFPPTFVLAITNLFTSFFKAEAFLSSVQRCMSSLFLFIVCHWWNLLYSHSTSLPFGTRKLTILSYMKKKIHCI